MLEEAGVKLSLVVSDVMGKSGRAILDALCAGESDPARLAQRMHHNCQTNQEQARAALTGDMREHHRLLLQELLSLIDAQSLSIKHVEQEIERRVSPFEEQIKRCEQITGVSRQVVHVLMAEVGTDLARFPDAEHLSSWAGICPGHNESAGKRLSGRSKHGNRYVRATLVQAARVGTPIQNVLGRALSSAQKTSRK
ncbi:MAG TPA: IS110 family transposase [Ktedonobacteraceae bacterium]|nr:IS110 family transposase [Ktedonobacteraceae bacterium]